MQPPSPSGFYGSEYFNFVNVNILYKINRPTLSFISKVSLMHWSAQFLDSNIIVFAEASLNVTSSFRSFIVPCNSLICLFSNIVSSEGVFQVWHPVFIFRYKCCDVSSTSGLHCLGFCLLIAPRTSVHLIL